MAWGHFVDWNSCPSHRSGSPWVHGEKLGVSQTHSAPLAPASAAEDVWREGPQRLRVALLCLGLAPHPRPDPVHLEPNHCQGPAAEHKHHSSLAGGPRCWQNGRVHGSRSSHGQNPDVVCLMPHISLPFVHPHQ